MIPKGAKLIGNNESIIDSVFDTFMKENVPPKLTEKLRDCDKLMLKGIFMAGAQAFSAIIDGMEKAGLPDRVGAQTYGNMVKSVEHQMLGSKFEIGMEAMKMPHPSEVH